MFLLDGKVIPQGVAFTDANGLQYPANWLQLSSAEEKAAVGITEVADPVLADDRFYWSGDINNPKALEDVTETIEGTEHTTKGLKSIHIAQVKDTANKLLASTDWYITRKVEREVDVPTEVATKRAAIIAEATRLEAAITAATDVAGLITVLGTQDWE